MPTFISAMITINSPQITYCYKISKIILDSVQHTEWEDSKSRDKEDIKSRD